MAKFRCIAVFGLLLALHSGAVRAQQADDQTQASDSAPTPPPGPAITPYREAPASDDEVERAVGSPSIRMETCELAKLFEDKRVVHVDVSKTDIEQPGVIDALLSHAANYAWENCPRPRTNSMTGEGPPNGDYYYDLKQVVIYGPDGSRLFEATLGGTLRGDGFLMHGKDYGWNEIHDYVAEQAQQQAQAAAQAQQQAAQAQQQVVQAEQGHEFAQKFWGWVRLILAGIVLIWILVNREMLLRWYYGLKPHPATSMVERAVYAGREIDGELYERILRPVPGSRIEKQVRERQARDLTSQLRGHEAALRSEEAKRVDEVRRRVEQENAFARAQAELLRAGVDHEVAAARVDELRKAMRDR